MRSVIVLLLGLFVLCLPALSLAPTFYTAPCLLIGGDCNGPGGNMTVGPVDTTPYRGGFAVITIATNIRNACTSFTVTNTGGDTWVAHTNYASSGGPDVNNCLWTATNFQGNAGDIINASNTSGASVYASMVVGLFDTSRSTSSPFDQSSGLGSTGNVTTIAAGSVTPTQCNELIVSGLATTGASGTLSVDSGMTIGATIVDGVGGVNYWSSALAWKVQTSIAAINPTWTDSANITHATSVATIKAANSTCPGGNSLTPAHSSTF
jgi:hypothetical protein